MWVDFVDVKIFQEILDKVSLSQKKFDLVIILFFLFKFFIFELFVSFYKFQLLMNGYQEFFYLQGFLNYENYEDIEKMVFGLQQDVFVDFIDERLLMLFFDVGDQKFLDK